MKTPAEIPAVEHFLRQGGFIIIGQNRRDPHLGQPFEAWAYQGPLDFNAAIPITFGSGHKVKDCLETLNQQLKQARSTIPRMPIPALTITPPPKASGSEPLWRAVYTLDVPAANAPNAAALAHKIMTYPDSMAPVLDIIDSRGQVIRIDLSATEDPSGKEVGHV